MKEEVQNYLDEGYDRKRDAESDIINLKDFKEEICFNCHHKQPSCEENIEDCYESYKFKVEGVLK